MTPAKRLAFVAQTRRRLESWWADLPPAIQCRYDAPTRPSPPPYAYAVK
jgi:hypothetical protein